MTEGVEVARAFLLRPRLELLRQRLEEHAQLDQTAWALRNEVSSFARGIARSVI
jgi:hypothetical protein